MLEHFVSFSAATLPVDTLHANLVATYDASIGYDLTYLGAVKTPSAVDPSIATREHGFSPSSNAHPNIVFELPAASHPNILSESLTAAAHPN